MNMETILFTFTPHGQLPQVGQNFFDKEEWGHLKELLPHLLLVSWFLKSKWGPTLTVLMKMTRLLSWTSVSNALTLSLRNTGIACCGFSEEGFASWFNRFEKSRDLQNWFFRNIYIFLSIQLDWILNSQSKHSGKSEHQANQKLTKAIENTIMLKIFKGRTQKLQ